MCNLGRPFCTSVNLTVQFGTSLLHILKKRRALSEG